MTRATTAQWMISRPGAIAGLAGVLCVVLLASGCQSRVGIGDGSVTSPGLDSYRVEIHSFARYRYAYVDSERTPKEFRVCVIKSAQCIFRKTYDVVGWDVSWHTHWVSATEVQIDIFDFGKDVDHRGATDTHLVRRPIASVHLETDAQTGKVSDRMELAR
jgi:hypothetical protein